MIGLRALATRVASYKPIERYILFELGVTEARSVGYGDVELPSPTSWRDTDRRSPERAVD
jgi:hypothetical protein